MAFFDQVKGKISQASLSTMQKAKDISEVARLNSAIAEAESEINNLYTHIGFEVYKAYHDKPLEEVTDQIEKISELHRVIEEYQGKIKTISSSDICPHCGTKVKVGMSFCGNCGYKLSVPK